jgi:hypothetical protein
VYEKTCLGKRKRLYAPVIPIVKIFILTTMLFGEGGVKVKAASPHPTPLSYSQPLGVVRDGARHPDALNFILFALRVNPK